MPHLSQEDFGLVSKVFNLFSSLGLHLFLAESEFDLYILSFHLDFNIKFWAIQRLENLFFDRLIEDFDSQHLLASDHCLAQVTKPLVFAISFDLQFVKNVVAGPAWLYGFEILLEKFNYLV